MPRIFSWLSGRSMFSAMLLTMVIFILIIQLPDTLRSRTSAIAKFTTIQSREIDHEFSLDASKMRYKNRLTALPSKSEHLFSISIITAASTKQRFSSLVRLCDSLVKASYSGRTNIRLLFNIDVGTSAEVIGKKGTWIASRNRFSMSWATKAR